MGIKLYGMGMSTCARRCLATLEEKQAAYELVPVDLMKGEHKQPAFLAKQPFGQIPVLADGDVSVFESRAISRYVATKFASQGTALLGKTPQETASVDTWLDVESNHFNPPSTTLVFEKYFKQMMQMGPADEAVVEAQLTKLHACLAVYEKHLTGKQYLTGDNFSLADLSHLSYGTYLIAAGIDWTEKYPAVKAWWGRISTRPSWVKVSAM